jgi:hypothetical protein
LVARTTMQVDSESCLTRFVRAGALARRTLPRSTDRVRQAALTSQLASAVAMERHANSSEVSVPALPHPLPLDDEVGPPGCPGDAWGRVLRRLLVAHVGAVRGLCGHPAGIGAFRSTEIPLLLPAFRYGRGSRTASPSTTGSYRAGRSSAKTRWSPPQSQQVRGGLSPMLADDGSPRSRTTT